MHECSRDTYEPLAAVNQSRCWAIVLRCRVCEDVKVSSGIERFFVSRQFEKVAALERAVVRAAYTAAP